MGMGDDAGVATLHGRRKENPRRADAAAAQHAALCVGNAFLGAAVVIRVVRNAERLRAAHEGIAQGIGLFNIGNRKGAAVTVIAGVGRADLALALPEIGQHIVVAPAAIAGFGPGIEIAALAAVVNVAVDRTGATQGLAACMGNGASVQARAGDTRIHPVDRRVAQGVEHARGNVDEGVAIRRPGFKHAHAVFAVFGKAPGHHTTGGAGTDDDVVVRFFSHGPMVMQATFVGRSAPHLATWRA